MSMKLKFGKHLLSCQCSLKEFFTERLTVNILDDDDDDEEDDDEVEDNDKDDDNNV